MPPAAAASPDGFPQDFLKGVALSVWQNSVDEESNWTWFARRRNFWGQGRYKEAFLKSNDFWVNFHDDIRMTASLGATSFRFSFEWGRFEPKSPGREDPEAVAKYHHILDACEAFGLEPMVTLHHFTHPQWFEDRGGWAVEANIPLYVSYCKMIFGHFGHRVRLWATMNEPTCFAFVGYIVGLWAPGKLMRLNEAGTVLCNLLKGHCAAYRAIKQMPGGQAARVGLVHQHIMFEPRHDWHHVRAMCKWMTFWFGTYTVLAFFQTGMFVWETPFSSKAKVLHVDEGIKAGERVVDWWGINYYSRPAVHWNFSMGASAANEPVTDTNFRIHPQGLYDSIKDASILNVPMYITETGLADAQDKHRAIFIHSHYGMLLKALDDGYDVRGAFWWTLQDNLEWHEGFLVKFGLYEWCPSLATTHAATHGRPPTGLRLRRGALALREVHAQWPDSLPALRAYAAQRCSSSGAAAAPMATTSPASAVAVAASAVSAAEGGKAEEQVALLAAGEGAAAGPSLAAAGKKEGLPAVDIHARAAAMLAAASR